MLCLSDFELYSRWVPLKQPRVGTSENVSRGFRPASGAEPFS